jgi:hypothetical protein
MLGKYRGHCVYKHGDWKATRIAILATGHTREGGESSIFELTALRPRLRVDHVTWCKWIPRFRGDEGVASGHD